MRHYGCDSKGLISFRYTLESKPVGNRGCLLNSSHKLNCVWVGTTALRLERKKFQNCLDNKYFFSII